MKKIRIICLLLAALMLFGTVCIAAEEEGNDQSVLSGSHSADAAQPLMGSEKLQKNAQAMLLYETGSDTLLYAYNADAVVSPASLVKIMTALLVLENAQLTDAVTVSQSAIKAVPSDAVSVSLQEGEILTVEQLIYCLLVYSANDAAAVLAEHISGSQKAFVNTMNQKAQALGCVGTNFVNATGLHHQEQVTTARDVAKILKEALKFDFFRQAFGTTYYIVEKTNKFRQRTLTSNNHLMSTDTVTIHFDPRVTGGRTGVTSTGHRNMATVAKDGNMELICVVLGSADELLEDSYRVKSYGTFPETSYLLDTAFQQYSREQVIFRNEILGQETVLGGECDVFIASRENYFTVLPAGTATKDLTYRYTPVNGSPQAPIKKDQHIANLQVWSGSTCVAQTAVYAMNDVDIASVKVEYKNTSSGGLAWWGVLLVVLGVLAVAFASTVLVLRARAMEKNRRRKKRR